MVSFHSLSLSLAASSNVCVFYQLIQETSLRLVLQEEDLHRVLLKRLLLTHVHVHVHVLYMLAP